MALQQVKFAPGIDKQDTSVGAVGRWVDSDNVRFRYGLPEKIGGWQSLLTNTIVGVARKQHAFVDNEGNRYVAIGTDKFLLIYFEGQLFDITPFRTDAAGAVVVINSVVATANNSNVVTITTGAVLHGLEVGDMIVFDNFVTPTGSVIPNSDFEDKLYQVITVPNSTTFTVTSPTTEGAASANNDGSANIKPYQTVGPAEQTYGYGWGIGNYGGTINGAATTTINNGGVLAAGATSVILTDSSVLPANGTLLIGNELMTYTTNTTGTNTISGISRGALGTTDVEHANAATVTNATNYNGWGTAVEASSVTLEPGLWSLDNFGQVLVATIANGKTFTWNAGIIARLDTRASQLTTNFQTTNNPDATRIMLISPTTRHLIHLGTETTIGNPDTQDDMFIRFSEQENIDDYTITAVNTAGSQRLQDGTRIMGAIVAKENILVWTDNALYTMKFVGAPFTFGFEQVGTNCGLIGQNAAIEIDGVAYWMSNNGFFSFDGTVNTLPCSVEDYVYDDIDTTKGQQICAGINNLFTEVTWWYPSSTSDFNNRYVVYNYGQTNTPAPMGNWYTGVNVNSIRTSWTDSLVYPRPYATAFNDSTTGTFPSVGGLTIVGSTTYFEHEVGTDQINPNGTTTALTSFIESFDFALQTDQGIGEYFLSMSRFLPNFKVLTGTVDISVLVTPFPAAANINAVHSPFTIDSSTQFVSTRARGRYATIKIENKNINEAWRFGTFQTDLRPDGRR